MRRVLVVDDEAAMAGLISGILAADGYDVVTETDPTAARRRVEAGERYDLAVLDVVMPALSGDELARIIHRHHDAIRVLFVTGFDEALFQARPTLWESEAFLGKPFTTDGLLEAVSMVLYGTTRPPQRLRA
jgi:DNA-binding response OmpR family regulator